MRNGRRCTAILLAAGSGSRMKSSVAKQYLPLAGKPLIYYALQAIEQSRIVDDCVLVTGEKDLEYVRLEIVEKYGFYKVNQIVAGGEERCFSVWNALDAIQKGALGVPNRDGLIFIHDGARPFLTEELLERTAAAAEQFHACVAAVPSKDTVKIADEEQFAVQTPDRRTVWNIQTPQVFDTKLVTEAYGLLMEKAQQVRNGEIPVTDDAGVVERFTDTRVRLVEGSYRNLKITTPEDLKIAEVLM